MRHRFRMRSHLAVALVGAFVAAAASAGARLYDEVGVSGIAHTGVLEADGDVGYAHNTPDSKQEIGCYTLATDVGSVSGGCFAVVSQAATYSCFTQDPQVIAVIQAIASDSHLTFNWDASGHCDIQLLHESQTAPKS